MKSLIFLSLFVCQSLLAGPILVISKAPVPTKKSQPAQPKKAVELKSALLNFHDIHHDKIANCADVAIEQDQSVIDALHSNIDEIVNENKMSNIYLLQYCIGKVLSES